MGLAAVAARRLAKDSNKKRAAQVEERAVQCQKLIEQKKLEGAQAAATYLN